jgi:chromosome segregation protein
MTARFARLRIAGFKSFADATTVEILPGLTGVVGPNGCGKSNVIEALRWAMGEASARNMRGAEMEDVIFAGTAGRASRNLAEVTLTLEDTAGLAPPPFHEAADLEISRKIERGSGSSYRVNGKEARARDVQTLFADLASGARASAMVSQGRVGSLVNARPDERRALLEEAAGITGLHARRHEAELKLRAAEQNLSRAEDLKAQIESRLAELKKQSRQAARYRNLSGAIRAAEAELLAIQRMLAQSALNTAQSALAAAETRVTETTIAAAEAAARAASTQAALPELRSAEGHARTALERARIAQEQSAEAEARARAALAEARNRLDMLRRDQTHAAKLVDDAAAAQARLDQEQARLLHETVAAPAELAAAGRTEDLALEARREAEAASNRATEIAARIAAETDSARRALAEAESRAKRAAQRHAESNAEFARLAARLIPPEQVTAAELARSAAEIALLAAREGVATAEATRAEAETALATARTETAGAESAAAKISAEHDALAALLAQKFGRETAPILDDLSVPPGLEAALGAALREELSASANPDAARHWRQLPPLDLSVVPLRSFASLVSGPAALTRALSHILLLPDGADGDLHQGNLTPGQILVSREGAVWRWDGYTIRAGAASEAAVRLAQRNRLTVLEAEKNTAAAAAAAARSSRLAAESAERLARAGEAAARDARREAEQTFDRARGEYIRLAAEAERAQEKFSTIRAQRDELAVELAQANASLGEIQAKVAQLPDLAVARAAVEAARTALAQARAAESAARQRLESLRTEDLARNRRLEILERERCDWLDRGQNAAERLTDLAARRQDAEAAHAALETAPETAAIARREALDHLAAAEVSLRRTAETLHVAQTEADEAARQARAAETALAAAREGRAREEGNIIAANHAWGTVAERILERLGADPALPDPPAEITADVEEKARKRWDRLTREREEMGPVNLRADIEAAEQEDAIATIDREQGEITTAIAKLRGSIGHLNREGRERLSSVFNEVDRHFQTLFARMFGGGKAHLALVGSDDPLEAGLEIYAQPPGKKLATLSLLSGGEQALTALSLIFAVFKCNPAPISVLDEVDAPLDDANVERFCTLLEDMVRETGTRFLVVTHHHLTMARMDRLYGVTMQERGISRLLSVDLARAIDITEPAGHAIAAE